MSRIVHNNDIALSPDFQIRRMGPQQERTPSKYQDLNPCSSQKRGKSSLSNRNSVNLTDDRPGERQPAPHPIINVFYQPLSLTKPPFMLARDRSSEKAMKLKMKNTTDSTDCSQKQLRSERKLEIGSLNVLRSIIKHDSNPKRNSKGVSHLEHGSVMQTVFRVGDNTDNAGTFNKQRELTPKVSRIGLSKSPNRSGKNKTPEKHNAPGQICLQPQPKADSAIEPLLFEQPKAPRSSIREDIEKNSKSMSRGYFSKRTNSRNRSSRIVDCDRRVNFDLKTVSPFMLPPRRPHDYFTRDIVRALTLKATNPTQMLDFYNELLCNQFKETYCRFMVLSSLATEYKALKTRGLASKPKLPQLAPTKRYLFLDIDETLSYCANKPLNPTARQIYLFSMKQSVSSIGIRASPTRTQGVPNLHEGDVRTRYLHSIGQRVC